MDLKNKIKWTRNNILSFIYDVALVYGLWIGDGTESTDHSDTWRCKFWRILSKGFLID